VPTNNNANSTVSQALVHAINAPVISQARYTAARDLTEADRSTWEHGGFERQVTLVVRPGGDHRIIFRDEQMRIIHNPADFYQAQKIFLTNDHEPGEVDGLTIFDQTIKVYSTQPGAISNRLKFNYVSGGSYNFRDAYSLCAWSGNTQKLAVSHAEVM
jgi:hypothetical protein